jgi:peptidoglycan/LPS O-acetylase OafA/YrhL
MIIFVMAAMFWLWRIYAAWHGASYEDLYPRFDFRADALLVGCGLSVLLSKIDLASYPRFWRFCSLSLGPLAVGMIVVGLTMNHRMMWYYYVSPLFGAIPSAISVIGLLHPDKTFMHRLYEHPVPVFCGRICYGLYVWHVPIFVWISSWPTKLYIILFLVGWPLTFAVATLSYYLIERPAMRIRPSI